MPHSPLYQKILDEARASKPRARRAPSRAPDPVSNNALDAALREHVSAPPPRPADFVTTRPVPGYALRACSVRQLAEYARADWRPNYAAEPYLIALCHEDYGHDGEKSTVLYFLSNAKTWRGPVARAVKAELRRRFA